MIAKHTPIPWAIETENESIGTIIDKDRNAVAQVAQMLPIQKDVKQEHRKANAAFIVKAVNNHDALVNALWGVLLPLSNGGAWAGCSGDQQRLLTALDKAREVLKASQ